MSDSRSVFVLVVDDTPENLLSVSVLLQAPGRTIVTAVSGEEALEKVGLHDYAVALLDVQLPGLDGFAVAERIRAEPASKHLPIIFVTGMRKTDVPPKVVPVPMLDLQPSAVPGVEAF
jgi:CheY-like chemotaxis protein